MVKLVKALGKFGMFLLSLFLFSSFAEAQDMLRAVVTGDNVNIRSAPNTKGKVYRQAYKGDVF